MDKQEQALEIVADAIVKRTTEYYQSKLEELEKRELPYNELCAEMKRMFGVER